MIFMRHLHHSYEFPARSAPLWADAVERWPQLDACAYGLPELFQHTQPAARPDLILLASPESSNHTDFGFVKTGASSPAKFVHTLPNSRSAALLQVMGWSGPLLCLQDDPQTVTGALLEASSFAESGKRVWLFCIERRNEQAFTAHLFDLSRESLAGATWSVESRTVSEAPKATDRDLFSALQNSGLSQEIVVFNNLWLKKLSV